MPNWTWNTMKVSKKLMKELVKEENGEKIFSFNNILPMPEELKYTQSGSVAANITLLYLLENFTKEEVIDIYKSMHMFGAFSDRIYGPFTKKALIEEIRSFYKDKLYTEETFNNVTVRYTGKDYYEIFKKYGTCSWYDWSCANWGVKWDASDVSIEDDTIYFTTPWGMPEEYLQEVCRRYPKEKLYIEAEYEDNLLVEAENDKGTFHIIAEYAKNYDDIADCENDEEYDDLPWSRITRIS